MARKEMQFMKHAAITDSDAIPDMPETVSKLLQVLKQDRMFVTDAMPVRFADTSAVQLWKQLDRLVTDVIPERSADTNDMQS